MKFSLSPKVLISLFVPMLALNTAAAPFDNPAKKETGSACNSANLNSTKFENSDEDFKLAACAALDRIVEKINSPTISPAFHNQLREMWDILVTKDVYLQPLKSEDTTGRMLALTEVTEANPKKIHIHLYLREKKLNDPLFPYGFIHELRHAYDFYNAWKVRGPLSSFETERSAFYITSQLAEESQENKKLAKNSLFWDVEWAALAPVDREAKRYMAIEKYLRKSRLYQSKRYSVEDTYDFSANIRPDKPEANQASMGGN